MLERNTRIAAERALRMAAVNPNSHALFVCGKAVNVASIWKYLIRNKVADFTYEMQSRKVTHKDGGVIRFAHCETGSNGFSAMQVSHLWLDEYVVGEARAHLRSRVRSALKHNDPIGVYTYYGLEVQ